MSNIALVGATGNIGQKVLLEGLSRGHRVTGTTRDAVRLQVQHNLTIAEVQPSDVAALSSVLRDHDVAVLAIKWSDNDIHRIIDAVERSGIKRAIFVVGAGSLTRSDGRIHFEHMPNPPPSSKPAMLALDAVRAVDAFDWTAISPPAIIRAGERTGIYRMDLDNMVEDINGNCQISREDFAVAIIDEIEAPKHTRQRFTVGY